MPLGIQRLNAKKSQPNALIVFIKPLKGPDEATAQDFLERIAAQCRRFAPAAARVTGQVLSRRPPPSARDAGTPPIGDDARGV